MSMTPRQKRRFLNQFRKQVEEERNGAPIPGDVAARMTKPKEPDILHQIVVTVRESGRKVPLGPKMCAEALGQAVEAINKQIIQGQRRDWIHAEIVPLTPVSLGVH
jgi:hypothetical protein